MSYIVRVHASIAARDPLNNKCAKRKLRNIFLDEMTAKIKSTRAYMYTLTYFFDENFFEPKDERYNICCVYSMYNDINTFRATFFVPVLKVGTAAYKTRTMVVAFANYNITTRSAEDLGTLAPNNNVEQYNIIVNVRSEMHVFIDKATAIRC